MLRGFPLKFTRRLENSAVLAENSKRRVNFCSFGRGVFIKVSEKNQRFSFVLLSPCTTF